MTILVMYTKACIRTGVKLRRRAPETARSPCEEGEGFVAETNVSDLQLTAADLAAVNGSFESAPASAVIRWAIESFGDSLVLAASFEDVVLIDLVTKVAPAVEVVFLDTEAHFPETLSFVDDMRERYGLNLTVTKPGPEAVAYPCGSDQCCRFRKVEPLRHALAGKRAWLTSLKRSDGPTRADAPIVSWDAGFGLVKVNPLATWTEDDISSYLSDHELPVHPLTLRGYRSIGCAPTTRPVAEGEDARAGRWAGADKSECGLHV
jgi:phosphoadenosine phosphosulfate reductase